MRWIAGSSVISSHAPQPALSLAAGSGAPRARSAATWAISCTTRSRTASNSAAFVSKWWYSAPLATPAAARISAIDVAS